MGSTLLNVRDDTIKLLDAQVGQGGSWSDKISRVLEMAGTNGDYWIVKNFDAMMNIYPAFEEHFRLLKDTTLAFHEQKRNLNYLERDTTGLAAELDEIFLGAIELMVAKVDEKLVDYRRGL